MIKVMVTGATGMLGRAVMARFKKDADYELIGLCHSRTGENLVQIDLADNSAIDEVLAKHAPDVIVHTAAIRKPDEFANDVATARKLNVDATQALADWTAKDPSRFLVYISSDYVFDGTTPPYTPESPTHAINAYGVSKLDGEICVRNVAEKQSAILRVPILYGDVENLQESSVTTVIEQVIGLSAPRIFDDWAIRYPTHVADVADVLAQIVRKHVTGTYHWSGSEAMTKLDMARVTAEILGIDASLLKGSGAPANGSEPRPKDCHLDRGALEALGITTPGIPFATAARYLAARHSP